MNVRFGGLFVIPTPKPNSGQHGWEPRHWRGAMAVLEQQPNVAVLERQDGIATLVAARNFRENAVADLLMKRGQPFMYLPVDAEKAQSAQHQRVRTMLGGAVSSMALSSLERMA